MELVTYFTENGSKTALIKRGRKLIHVLLMDGGLTVRKVPLSEERYMRPVIGTKNITIKGAARTLAGYGRRHGMTKAAKQMLREARS